MVKVTPNCKYGHGDLILASKNQPDQWAYMNVYNQETCFTGKLYFCPKCGYTEFFDSDVILTVKQSDTE